MFLAIITCALSITAAEPQFPSHSLGPSHLAQLASAARRNRAACGPLAVGYVLERLGHRVDIAQMIEEADLNEKGAAIGHLLQLLAQFNCPGRALYTRRDRISLLPSPSIVFVDRGAHCIVFDGLHDNETARIFETTTRRVKFIPLNDLKQMWTGEAIVFDAPRPSSATFWLICFFAMMAILAPVACLVPRRQRIVATDRSGVTLVEMLCVIAIAGVMCALLLPAIQQARESSRASQCRNNLRNIGIGLQNYEVLCRIFPPAVIWAPAGEPLGQSIAVPGSVDRISLDIASPVQPDRVYANWAILLLPFLGQENLYGQFNLRLPIADTANATGRSTRLPIILCPTDDANQSDNPFQRSGITAADQGYARGNYAINGGTNRRCLMRLSSRKCNCTDGVNVNGTDLRSDTSQVWGNGVAGLNRAMTSREFTGGLSRLIMVEEIRAGLNPLDRRGVWALGFPGSSITACHGLYGNNGPNVGNDAIQGCSQIAELSPDLAEKGMPCLQSRTDPRLEISERATARSMHSGGVNLLMGDGSARYVLDSIGKQLWHNLHRRDNTVPLEL